MKPHGQFTEELIAIAVKSTPGNPGIVGVDDVIRLSRMGVSPEGADFEIPPAVAKAIGFNESKSRYSLGPKSLRELEGVHPQLVRVVQRAIELTTQDFTVHDGLRTPAEQARLKANGASKTLDSCHLKQADGFGHAVDLVPYIGGVLKWDWDGCYKIALAMDQAATEQGVAHMITWGGAWDRNLADFGGHARAYLEEVEAYKIRHAGKDFIDGPHYQWRR